MVSAQPMIPGSLTSFTGGDLNTSHIVPVRAGRIARRSSAAWAANEFQMRRLGSARRRNATSGARRIGIVAPSGYLPEPNIIDRAAAFFGTHGWQVEAGESVFA